MCSTLLLRWDVIVSCYFSASWKDSITDTEIFARGATTEGIWSILFQHKRYMESAMILFVPNMKPTVKSISDGAMGQRTVTGFESNSSKEDFNDLSKWLIFCH